VSGVPEAAGEATYQRRPDQVRAIRWNGDNIEAVMALMAPTEPRYMAGFANADDLIGTPGGVAEKGDWIVRRADGLEVWPLKPIEFDRRYTSTAVIHADLRERLLSDEAIEAAGHASRTYAAADPCAPQTWEATPDSHKAIVREAARLYIGAALDFIGLNGGEKR
jgi:hypothetical protein